MALEAARAHALEMVHAIHAGAAVLARHRAALVNVNAAIFAGESGPTIALVIVVQIDT